MHFKTKEIFKNLPVDNLNTDSKKLLTTLNDDLSLKRHTYLNNQYEGETAFILTCGPSMNLIWNEELNNFLKNKLVISIKQTHLLDETLSDFHLLNFRNLENYKYPESTIIMSNGFLATNHSHIQYKINSCPLSKTLVKTQDYEKWDMKNSFLRPWGPGIIIETALQLPVYLGCKKIVIMGFDLNKEGQSHFYACKEKDLESYVKEFENKEYAEWLLKEEFDNYRTSMVYYERWLNKQGINIKLYSPLSTLPFEKSASFQDLLAFYNGESQ